MYYFQLTYLNKIIIIFKFTLVNDRETPLRVRCYFSDPATWPQLACVQFTQIFRGVNKNDIYNAEFKCLYQINVMGFDGLSGLIILQPDFLSTTSFTRKSIKPRITGES